MSPKIILLSTWNKLRFYFSFLLLGFYLTVAFLFLFSGIWADMVPKGRAIIGIVILLFAALRFYVAYRRYKNRNGAIQSIKEATQTNAMETKQDVTVE